MKNKGSAFLIRGARLWDEGLPAGLKVGQKGEVLVRAGRVERIVPPGSHLDEHYETFDASGLDLIPGMIDVHIHGAEGHDMMDGKVESVQAVSRVCAACGCTGFLATSVTSDAQALFGFLRAVKKTIGQEIGASVLGIHLEGPYLNAVRKGMQPEAFIRHPNLDEMKSFLDEGDGLVKMVTLAPEVPGGLELIDFLVARGIVAAVAHSNATYEQAVEAFKRGATHITHCFNAMPPIHHRDPGLIAAALENDDISVQAITDGIHLHPAIVRLLFKIKGPEKVALITDALQAMGLGDGEYVFGTHRVKVEKGAARLVDGTLASSIVKMNEALRNTISWGVERADAVRAAGRTPAEILGLPTKGRLIPGSDADLVLLDPQGEVTATWIGGRRI